MLQAISRNKTKLYKRYLLRHRRSGTWGERVPAEDEIVSTILGPLEFMPPEDSWVIWRQLAKLEKLAPPLICRSSFWPSRLCKGGRRIEPDALVELTWKDGTRELILFEFKWASPLSGERQLQDQWNEFLTEDERQRARHVFIGLDKGPALEARSNGDVWKDSLGNDRLSVWTWKNFHDMLSLSIKAGRTQASNPIKVWVEYVRDFLNRVGVREFGGFGHLAIKMPSIGGVRRAYSFRSHPFRGFAGMQQLQVACLHTARPLFGEGFTISRSRTNHSSEAEDCKLFAFSSSFEKGK